ncbi:Phosphotransferase system, phosphocarrier protein PtsH (HPr; Histidine-containing protein) [Desulfatibacillum aliphaticivorans]|uniref:Phosphotransferase system, phosphocarrier protein PtsH (HPr Histidine-containing protein) n=2 Tax=Desulfatibacillum aliphaticivorans TaxID=218208 RepID=B8FEW2_DESAL|nr:Phosphotransferase system, phosphocarrier protein PtsH (HPr; Histidine-containing protein) [Desulfatibacillum aliphaticivorans]
MNQERNESMQEVTLIIKNELGLHARCAAMVAKTASKAKGAVFLSASGNTADATDILDMLMLAPHAAQGMEISIAVQEASDAEILEELAALVEDGFGEY